MKGNEEFNRKQKSSIFAKMRLDTYPDPEVHDTLVDFKVSHKLRLLAMLDEAEVRLVITDIDNVPFVRAVEIATAGDEERVFELLAPSEATPSAGSTIDCLVTLSSTHGPTGQQKLDIKSKTATIDSAVLCSSHIQNDSLEHVTLEMMFMKNLFKAKPAKQSWDEYHAHQEELVVQGTDAILTIKGSIKGKLIENIASRQFAVSKFANPQEKAVMLTIFTGTIAESFNASR